ncbi:MAG TPA: AmmeMemoRadiSam system radical SAM enzyme [Lacipirellulaceae bacterium]|nr:AmmeMemoRadiSam system radical SAM enzyme [Lacipirellulaceae bacterium]
MSIAHELLTTVPTKYWHALEDGRIQCDLCPRFCKLHDAQRGFCFVRACQDGQVVLTTYGRSSGFCVDPIEKKPLNHFLPGTPVLSFGTAGCNLGCKFCQNWDISKSREIDTLADMASPEVIARTAAELGCRSVAFTYNDPVIFHEYAIDVAAACRDRGIKTVAVTAGEVCAEPRVEFYRWMDAANVDLKGFTEKFYHDICAGHLAPVLETLEYLKHETDVWFEITTLLIPGANDSDKEIEELTQWVVERLGPDVPQHFTAFHPDYRMLDLPPAPPATLRRAREIALKNGVRYAYVGNVHDAAGDSTYCHACGQLLIGRDWYVLTKWNLDVADDQSVAGVLDPGMPAAQRPATEDVVGRCPHCGTPCDGVFEIVPGRWGARRVPVRLADFR